MQFMESDPQGELTGEWVKEAGKSESRAVMARIRVWILPGTKVSRLPAGVESRETFGQCYLYGEDRR